MSGAVVGEKHQPQAVKAFVYILVYIVYALAAVSAAGVVVMIFTICADVLLRLPIINQPFAGAYDIVSMAGAVTLAAALPYTTAVKGHVAIEFFFHKLNRVCRIIVDTLMRLLSIALFGILCWRSWQYGLRLYDSGQTSQTLQLPIFWIPWLIAFSSFIVMLVVAYHLVYPRRELIKP